MLKKSIHSKIYTVSIFNFTVMFWGFKVKMCTCKLFYGVLVIIITVTQKATTVALPSLARFLKIITIILHILRDIVFSYSIWDVYQKVSFHLGSNHSYRKDGR